MNASRFVTLTTIFLMLSIMIVISEEKFPEFPLKSTAAHESSTGAPGERTCAQSGCHEMSELISDDTTNSLVFSDGNSTFGDAMEGIRLIVRKKDCVKFGFQIVCLDSLNKNVGSWVLLSKERVQMQNADFSVPGAAGRKYLTHTFKGTQPQITGEIYWDFSWLPPTNGYKGPVTFYVMSNCTNNDNKNSGDALFASKHALKHVSATTGMEEDKTHDMVVFQRQAGTWTIPLNVNSEIKNVIVHDMKGRKISADWSFHAGQGIEIITHYLEMQGLAFITLEYESGALQQKTVFFHQ